METEEIFKVLSCTINKSPKLQGKLRTVLWVVWMMLSRQKHSEDWTMTSLRQLKSMYVLCLSFTACIRKSMFLKRISPFSLIASISTSTYRLLSSADCKGKLMQWNQWLCKWYPWEQEEWLKCCLCARQSWEPLPYSLGSFFRIHHKMVSVWLQHFPCKPFTMKATMIGITCKTKYGVPGRKICHLYEL